MARVLAVDDDLTVLTLIRRYLKVAGHDVVMARDGEDALAQLRTLRPDVVVCDVNMPGKNGFEVLEAIRADPDFASQPFVLLTSEDDRDSIRRGMRLGADDFLSKPADSKELVESIARVLDKKRRLSSLVAATALSSSSEMRAHYASALSGQTENEVPGLAAKPASAASALPDRPATGAAVQPEIDDGVRTGFRTVLACGIVDFGALSGRLQSEDLAALLDAYLQTTIQSILAHGGQVLKLMGDNVVAMFGHNPDDVPAAAAAAALRAALDVVHHAVNADLASTLPPSLLAPAFEVVAGVHSASVTLSETASDAPGSLVISGAGVELACLLRDRATATGWRVAASVAAVELAGPAGGFNHGAPQVIDSGGIGAPLLAVGLTQQPATARHAPGAAMNAALAAVLHENARSGAQASKAALDAALEALNDAESAEFEVLRPAGLGKSRLPPIRGYRIERKIGEGGMSTVYLAESEARSGKVVLKVLKGQRGDDEALWARFFQECAILSSIKHEHVVRIYDQGFGDEFAYIAMEHLAGGGLTELIRAGVTPRQAMSLLSQAAGALAEIHRRGILHRDIKPANFLLRAQSVLVLTDFGVAKRVGQSASHTLHGEVLGTPYYVSPEQAQGGKVTPAADIYSLGVIFHELLCGRRPFDGETLMEILSQHLTAPIPRLPEELAEYQPLIDGMLAKQVEDRFQDSHAVLDEIDRIWTLQAVRKMQS